MATDLNTAVLKSINHIKKAMSAKSSELARLQTELRRHQAVLGLLGRAKKSRGSARAPRGGGNLADVLTRLPMRFASRDFFRAAAKLNKSSVYLRQTLSRWAKQGKIKRVKRGKYYKAGAGRRKSR